jgi:hypothetical protein
MRFDLTAHKLQFFAGTNNPTRPGQFFKRIFEPTEHFAPSEVGT